MLEARNLKRRMSPRLLDVIFPLPSPAISLAPKSKRDLVIALLLLWIVNGLQHAYRRGGSAGSRAFSLLEPKRLRKRLTVAAETPTSAAIA